jgi:hypothetical protein
MTLANKILDFKVVFVSGLESLTEQIATKIFNYPQNLGMPLTPEYDAKQQSMVDYLSQLPIHQTNFPPPAAPATLSQVFLEIFQICLELTEHFMNINQMGFIIFTFQIIRTSSFYLIGYHNGFKLI